MPLTIDQIKEEVGKSPELKTGILGAFKDDFIQTATSDGHVYRSKADDEAYHTNRLNSVLPTEVEKKFTEKYRESLNQMDVDIEATTGVKKNPDEKTIDYFKRATAELKKTGGDHATKARIEQLEKLLKEKEDAFAADKKKWETDTFDRQRTWAVREALNSLQIIVPTTLKTEKEKQEYATKQRGLIERGLLATYSAKLGEDGELTWYEGEKPLLDTKDGKPQKVTDLVRRDYGAWLLPEGKQAAGTGTNGAGAGQAGSGGGTGGAFKTKEDIHKHLAELGMEATSKEYMNELNRLAAESKIRI